jgi:hypothetical protein
MNRLSFEVSVGGLTPETDIKLTIGKKELIDSADEEGMVYFDCKKLIKSNLRSEAIFLIASDPPEKHIYEIRKTKLVPKRIVEIRKEK